MIACAAVARGAFKISTTLKDGYYPVLQCHMRSEQTQQKTTKPLGKKKKLGRRSCTIDANVERAVPGLAHHAIARLTPSYHDSTSHK